MRSAKRVDRWSCLLCVLVLTGAALAMSRPAWAQHVSSQSLIWATYDGETTANQVFQTMKANQNATGERIQSYAVVSKDLKGKTKVHDQREKDAKVGAVIGAVIGVVGGPVGSVAAATAGGALGYLTGDTVGIPRQTVDDMKAGLTPGSSALFVVLEDRWVQDFEKGLREAHARQVIGAQIAAGAATKLAPAPAPATRPKP
jgi:uncharacterized membrane protein